MKVDERTCVDLTLLLELDWPGSMAGPLYVSKTVDFERIAELSVESQTPDHLVGIELEFVYGPTYGLELYFGSRRSGGYGSYDIWVSRIATKDDPWEQATNLGPVVNSSAS